MYPKSCAQSLTTYSSRVCGTTQTGACRQRGGAAAREMGRHGPTEGAALQAADVDVAAPSRHKRSLQVPH